MEVSDAIKQRRSTREYSPAPVETEKLVKILEAARLAPSASNRQEWRFIVVNDPDTRQKLSQAAKNQKFVAQAPTVIACCAVTDEHTMTCGQLCYPIDCAIAIDHMTLQATELGVGSCWVGAFHENEVKKILSVPEDIRVVELLTLGYPAQKCIACKKQRLSLKEIAFKETWGAVTNLTDTTGPKKRIRTTKNST